VDAQSRQEHFFHFFLLLVALEKLTKIDFSSVIAKRGFVPKKLLLRIISKNIHFDDYYSFFNKIISLAS
jgi:hypothetical protein